MKELISILAAMAALMPHLSLAGAAAAEARLTIRADQPGPKIDRNIYGHFAEHLGRCVYEGFWVGEDSPIPNTRGIRKDVVEALKKLRIPVLRWPGGCFADEYHWKDGIGPRHLRPSMINTHWGGVVENNHFGTHEFLDLCEQLGTEPYISGNVGSGTIQEMMEWVEYITSDADSPMANLRRQNGRQEPWKLRYFGIGNESWGCGGNMRPEFYADLYRQYNTFVKNHGANRVYRIACGANSHDFNWTEVLMDRVGRRMNGLSLHYYTVSSGRWEQKGSATRFGEAEWHGGLHQALVMDELVGRHAAIMDRFDPDKRIGMIVDEWGMWHDPEPGTNPGFLYQQNTLRDALVAGLTFHIFHRHADRVRMANIAQTINVLQAMILTDYEKMILTPTYHVFEMYAAHHDATFLPTEITCPDYTVANRTIPALSASTSRAADGAIHISLCNLHPTQPLNVRASLAGASAKAVSGRLLTADAVNAHNTFEQPGHVRPVPFPNATLSPEGIDLPLPARSIVVLRVE
jgi:alpha-N-arabinofuranosidase